jgi:HEAT repeat protein
MNGEERAMEVTFEQVRRALSPDELNYRMIADELGADALPMLERIVGGTDTTLAAKATYLAGVIGGAGSVAAVEKAASSREPTIRIAAAAVAARLPTELRDRLLVRLMKDEDSGVRKVAARSSTMPEPVTKQAKVVTSQLKRPRTPRA